MSDYKSVSSITATIAEIELNIVNEIKKTSFEIVSNILSTYIDDIPNQKYDITNDFSVKEPPVDNITQDDRLHVSDSIFIGVVSSGYRIVRSVSTLQVIDAINNKVDTTTKFSISK